MATYYNPITRTQQTVDDNTRTNPAGPSIGTQPTGGTGTTTTPRDPNGRDIYNPELGGVSGGTGHTSGDGRDTYNPSLGGTAGGTGSTPNDGRETYQPSSNGVSLDYQSYSDPTYQASAQGTNPLTSMLTMYEDLYKQNTQGSLNSYNMGANRLRDRLSSMGAGYEDAARNAALSHGGFGLDRGLQQARQNTMEQYGQGLVSLSDAYEKNRLQGLQQALSSAQGLQGESNFARTLAEQQNEYQNTWNLDKTKLAQTDAQQRAALAMQQYLAQLQDQTNRYGIDKGYTEGWWNKISTDTGTDPGYDQDPVA